MLMIRRSAPALQACRSCFAALQPYQTCRMLATQSSDQMVDDMIKFVRTGCQVQAHCICWQPIMTGHLWLTLPATPVVIPVYAPTSQADMPLAQPTSLHTGQYTASNRHPKHWFGSSNRQRAHTTATRYGRSASSIVQLGTSRVKPIGCK